MPLLATPNLEEILLNPLGTEALGIASLLVGTAATFLVFNHMGDSLRKRPIPERSPTLGDVLFANPRLSLFFSYLTMYAVRE